MNDDLIQRSSLSDKPDPFAAEGRSGRVHRLGLLEASRAKGKLKYRMGTKRTFFPCIISKLEVPSGRVEGKVRVKVIFPGRLTTREEYWVEPKWVQVYVGHKNHGTDRLIPLLEFRPKKQE